MTVLGPSIDCFPLFRQILVSLSSLFLVAIGIPFSFSALQAHCDVVWIRIFCGEKKLQSHRTLGRDFSSSASPRTRLDASLDQIAPYLLLATPCYSLRPLHRWIRNEGAASQNQQNWSAAVRDYV